MTVQAVGLLSMFPSRKKNRCEEIKPEGKSNPIIHPQPLEITLFKNPEEGL